MRHLGDVPANSILYLPFATYDGSGASVTMTNFALGDILIYKNGSTTQRSSTAGFTLLDTDGIDFDGITGLHGFSIDLSDNTDAGFYAVGSFYWAVVSVVTVSGQSVTLIAATFRIVAAEAIAGKPKVDVDAWLGTAAATPATVGIPDVNVKNAANTAWASGAITAASIAADAIGASELAADAVTEIQAGLATSAGVAALNNLSAAQVLTQVQGALSTDTYAEPGQGTPGATISLAAKIGYLYKAWRNRTTQTALEYALYNDDAVTKGQKAAVSDDATTFVREEVGTGA